MAPWHSGPSTVSPSTIRTTSILQRKGLFREIINDSEDLNMVDADTLPEKGSSPPKRKYYVAVDYGTTNSAVSLVALESGEDPELIDPDRVGSISDYPQDPRVYGHPALEVPTETCYLEPTTKRRRARAMQTDHTANATVDISEQDVEYDEDAPPCQSDEDETSEAPVDFLWGHQVRDALGRPNTASLGDMEDACLRRAKLVLDESKHTEPIREAIGRTMKHPNIENQVKEPHDIITHFLTELFAHVKNELEVKHGYTNECDIEFILCVPPIWSTKACRKMESAMGIALHKNRFGSTASECVGNLFIVSEPEAAAQYFLTNSKDSSEIRDNDVFLLIDAGGGTVDAITYSVEGRNPIRLKKELVKADGRLCGSAFINERFKAHVKDRLQDETYLETAGETIDQIIETELMVNFEHNIKRKMKFDKKALVPRRFHVRGLKANKDRMLIEGGFEVNYTQFWNIFLPSLKDVANLMESQLESARKKNIHVEKVVLIGGFANSPALIEYLTKRLEHSWPEVKLICPKIPNGGPGIAVASGAVLRALDKSNGPDRILRSSYGFLCREIYDKSIPGHKETKYRKPDIDGERYVNNTIDWLIKKGETVFADPQKRRYRIEMHQIFDISRKTKFICKEKLLVSDTSIESHYQMYHPKNKGQWEIADKLEVDLTFLKTQNRIQPVIPGPGDDWKPHYRVEFDIIIEVIDRNLYYHARWPIGDENGEIPGTRRKLSIAAAFEPGTK